ncbi:protein MAIN-LIKE 1 [Lathyrus oleraceus]|uniref:protein MAIN-LIKE 1 n=2 Tax=Pisum sativum TaxID=3888 RepID=UPI0021D37A28|nr:protein MAIN-LIKE 1-like [Pisum sativum]
MNGPPKAEALEPFILHSAEADHPMVKKIKSSWQAVIRKENGNLKDDQQKKDKELEISNKRARESEARREKFGQALYSTKSVFKSKEEELDRALLRIQKLNKILEPTLEMKREARLISEIRTRELENTIQKYKDTLEREKLKTEESERVCTRLKYHLERADARIQALEGGDQDAAYMVLLGECRYWRNLYRDIEERGPKKELKVAGHGLKLNSRVPLALPPQMESWVSRSGLASLQRTSLNKIDTNLVSAFVERWHLETSSFHMPFGEMSITLDDVACLLHLPIRGIFWSPQDVTEELAVELAVDYLGVSQSQAQSHVRSCRGSYYKLEWLYDIFVHHRAASSWAYATRAYLLMLVGSTIFADKTFTLVEARYLLLFRDLDGCSGYSWGAAALVTLYRYLGDASMYSCKQLGGYPTLLQCWIHEYFPTVGKRGENWNPAGNCGLPRAMRWSYRQGVLKVDDLRPILDELTPTDVIWRPFEDHRAWRVFDEICLYRGCLKWGETVVPYLPDRCLRQFGYRQYVPSPPLDCMMATDIDVDWISYHQSVVDVIGSSSVATTPSEVVDGYLEWYYRVSHPRLVPPHRDAPREVPVPVYDAGPSDPDWARVSTLIRRYLRQVNAEEEDPQFSDLFEALHISRSH